MSGEVDVAFVGLATMDTIVALPGWPDPDGRLLADALTEAGGGPAATAAVAAARLGRSVAFVGAVGNDDAGRAVRRELDLAGIDTSAVVELDGPTSRSVVLVDRRAGTRSILHAPGAALTELSPEASALCRRARWVHVDHAGWHLAADVARDRLSVDAGNPIDGLHLAGVGIYGPSRGALAQRFPGCDLATGITCALEEGARLVVVTLGSDGAVAASAGQAWRVGPASANASGQVVSTLGAGDVFHGAFLAALVDEDDVALALSTANMAAAMSCAALDGRSAIPGRAELESARRRAPVAARVALEDLR